MAEEEEQVTETPWWDDVELGREVTTGRKPARLRDGKVIQPQRELPILGETDVLVVGAGPAGLGAAIAAARMGVRVTLVERYNHMGGMATGGLVLWMVSFFDEGDTPGIRGIAMELMERIMALEGGTLFKGGYENMTVDPEALKYLVVKITKEERITVILHTWGVDAVLDGNTVRGAVFESKSGRQAILAQVVVDATGDGDIFAAAGASFSLGHKGIGLPFRMGAVDTDGNLAFCRDHPREFQRIMAEMAANGGLKLAYYEPCVRPGVIIWNNSLPPMDALDVRNLTYVEMELRERIWNSVSYLRKHMPGFERAFLLETAPQLGVRDTRRLAGEYVLTKEDFDQHRPFPDVILYSPSRQVPYRCLVPREVDNLLVAGRCISTEGGTVQGNIRVIIPCLATGQAAGVAAALAVMGNVKSRDVDVRLLQRKLLAQGAHLGAEVERKLAVAVS